MDACPPRVAPSSSASSRALASNAHRRGAGSRADAHASRTTDSRAALPPVSTSTLSAPFLAAERNTRAGAFAASDVPARSPSFTRRSPHVAASAALRSSLVAARRRARHGPRLVRGGDAVREAHAQPRRFLGRKRVRFFFSLAPRLRSKEKPAPEPVSATRLRFCFFASTSARGGTAGPLAALPADTRRPHGPLATSVGSVSRVIFPARNASSPRNETKGWPSAARSAVTRACVVRASYGEADASKSFSKSFSSKSSAGALGANSSAGYAIFFAKETPARPPDPGTSHTAFAPGSAPRSASTRAGYRFRWYSRSESPFSSARGSPTAPAFGAPSSPSSRSVPTSGGPPMATTSSPERTALRSAGSGESSRSRTVRLERRARARRRHEPNSRAARAAVRQIDRRLERGGSFVITMRRLDEPHAVVAGPGNLEPARGATAAAACA